MRAVVLLFLVSINFGCLKKNSEKYVDNRPSFDPPISIEQLDLNQFDSDENQSEALTEVEEKIVFENFLETARLLYANSNVKRAMYRIADGKQPEQSILPVKEDDESTFFEEEKSAVLLLQTSLKPEICNPIMSVDSGVTAVLTNGPSCPLIINSKVSNKYAFGKERIDYIEREGTLGLSLRPELLVGFNLKNVIAIDIKSEEKSKSQFFSSPKDGYRIFQSQAAIGSIKLADGQSLPYTHQLQSVFSTERSEDDKQYKFRLVKVIQVKTVINGKAIVLIAKSSDGKKFEDSDSVYRCSINNRILSQKNCLIINSEFEHY